MSHDDNQERPPTKANFPVVGLGASAGGLDALNTFFDNVDAESGMAFVVALHLSSSHESLLDKLLQRHTKLQVRFAEEGMVIEPNNVYLLPPGKEVTIGDGIIHVETAGANLGWPNIIDSFYKSLAKEYGYWAAGLILSGMGTDGSSGATEIKNEGGVVIAQDPDDATHTGMINTIIERNLPDVVLPVKEMPEYLVSYFEQATSLAQQETDRLEEQLPDEALSEVIELLRDKTSYDFRQYKQSTLRRQVIRRMAVHRIDDVNDYLQLIERDGQEADKLLNSLLINVSNFFRDRDAFEALKTDAIQPMLTDLSKDTSLRVWVPGCAGGEEAYSIAILIHECLSELDKLEMDVRIFATDLNQSLLNQARDGVYPDRIAEHISQERLERYFVKQDDSYEVRNRIRKMIIWAEHNLTDDPPFSNLHMISCRNVMIYFQKLLQKRVIALFEYGLRPDGILFLGSSETIDYVSNQFETISSRYRIYRRSAGTTNSWMNLNQPIVSANSSEDRSRQLSSEKVEDQELRAIKEAVFDYYDFTCAVVNEYYIVLYASGNIDKYLKFPVGKTVLNVLEIAREGLSTELTVALFRASNDREAVKREGIWVKTNGDERIINLVVKPLYDTSLANGHYLIIFENTNVKIDPNKGDADYDPDEAEDGATVRRLRQELEETKQSLQTATQALQAKSEELSSSVEEIRSAHEEVQTTNEELLTSKEELESMNEELNMLNDQLADQNDELTRANNILHNILRVTQIGIILLDANLHIRRFTQAVTGIFYLRDSDIGRPLSEIAADIDTRMLLDDANHVLDTLETVEREIEINDNQWYKLAVRPYRTVNNVIDGVVLVFSDITEQKQVQEQLRDAQQTIEHKDEFMSLAFDVMHESILMLDESLRVVFANEAFCQEFEVMQDDTEGELLYNLGNGQWDIPELRRLIEDIIPEEKEIQDYEVTRDFPDIGQRTMRLNARQIDHVERILLVITDITTDTDAG